MSSLLIMPFFSLKTIMVQPINFYKCKSPCKMSMPVLPSKFLHSKLKICSLPDGLSASVSNHSV